MPPQAGTRLGPYEVVALIGAGGMGEVWLATELRLGRKVALKLLPADLTRDPNRIQRFEQEARAASALNHPNVCTIHALGETSEGQHYIAMEYVEGQTLRQRLTSVRLSVREALDIAIQVAAALSAAHAAGIIHRDIKPENVMLRRDDVVKVLDFGLAKLAACNDAGGALSTRTAFLTDAGTVVGTVAYMSPEQARGQEVDARTDIWSLGVVLYETMAGRSPFTGSSGGDVLAAVLEHDPPPLPAVGGPIPPELRRIVGKALRKDREQRYQTIKDLLLDLQALREESDLRLRSDSGTAASLPATNTPRSPIRNVALAAMTLAVAVAAFALGVRQSTIKPYTFPIFTPLTFQRGHIADARFAPDGQTIVYGAAWNGKPYEIFTTRRDIPESRSLNLPSSSVLAISSKAEMAISLGCQWEPGLGCEGTLARVPLSGGSPREVLAHVRRADWSSDGRAVAVIVREPSGVQRLEYPAGHAVASGGLSLARVARSGNRLAAYDRASGSILLIDGSGASTTIASGYGLVHGLAWSPEGDEIWFSGLTADGGASGWAILGVTPSGRQRVVYRADGHLVLQDVHRDGSMLITRVEPRLITIAAQTDSGSESDLSWYAWAGAVDLSRDGRSVLQGGLEFAAGGRHVLLLRKTDGSPPITLAHGYENGTLSADGQYVIATSIDGQKLSIIPTGPGSAAALAKGSIEEYGAAHWLPDGTAVVFSGRTTKAGWMCYLQDVTGGQPRSITSEGAASHSAYRPLVSRDGRSVVTRDSTERLVMSPVEGGVPQLVRGTVIGDEALQWAPDGRALFVGVFGTGPAQVYRIDLTTGRRELWKEIAPMDRAGLINVTAVRISADARSYVYGYRRFLSQLYLVEGLK